jgi:WD40 repeat protein
MQEVVDRWEKRRLLPREVAGEKQVALRESIEWKYQICYLFKALGKQEKYKKLQGVCDDPSWLVQQFAELLRVPRYALIKTCPRGDNADFDFHPLIYEEKVYSGSEYDDDIRVTNCNDDSLITTLTGHTGNVWCLIIDDDKLYSGSDDSTIKIWNCSTDTLIKTLTGHTNTVECLTISDGKLYSGGWDHSIMVWNCSNHELIATLGVPEEHDERGEYEGHTRGVHCLNINDGKLYSGSYDNTIKIWNCSTDKLITTLTEHTYAVDYLRIHGGKLYSKAHNGIKVYDCSDDTLTTTLEDHTWLVRCLEIHDGKLYTSSHDRTINVYGCSDDSLITTLRGHTDTIRDLTFQNGKLYSKQGDGAIYIWQL